MAPPTGDLSQILQNLAWGFVALVTGGVGAWRFFRDRGAAVDIISQLQSSLKAERDARRQAERRADMLNTERNNLFMQLSRLEGKLEAVERELSELKLAFGFKQEQIDRYRSALGLSLGGADMPASKQDDEGE